MKFSIIHGFIEKFKTPFTTLVTLVTFGIRYIICKQFTCALSYGLTALIITTLAFSIYNAIAKIVLKKQTEKLSKQLADALTADKSPVEVKAEEIADTSDGKGGDCK